MKIFATHRRQTYRALGMVAVCGKLPEHSSTLNRLRKYLHKKPRLAVVGALILLCLTGSGSGYILVKHVGQHQASAPQTPFSKPAAPSRGKFKNATKHPSNATQSTPTKTSSSSVSSPPAPAHSQSTPASSKTIAAATSSSVPSSPPASTTTSGSGSSSSPTPPPNTTQYDPSGVPLPGAIPGYQRVCGEDFTKSAAMGSWGTNDGSAVVYSDGCQWTEYPDGWPSTYTNGGVGYEPSQVLSVHDGVLDFYLHPINGHAAGANPSPILSSGSQYQAYGKYIIRMRTDAVAGYHNAFLLWPQSDSDWQYAESDFPEMDLTDSGVNAYAHYGGSGAQDAFSKTVDITQWHTYEQDWTPTSRSYYVDGQLIGTSTQSIYSNPERLQLQVEPSGTAAGGTGHELIDWVAIYAPN